MNPDEKQLLEKAVALSEENNKILRGMRRANRFAFAWKLIYWIAIIGISYGAYVYIQPYVNELLKTYNEIRGTAGKVQSAGDSLPDLSKLLDKLPK